MGGKAVVLTGEAIVAFSLYRDLHPKSPVDLLNLRKGRDSDADAMALVRSRRDRYLSENKPVFKPYFLNEPGVLDLDLVALRRTVEQASRGQASAQASIDSILIHYHLALAMYYGWLIRVLAGTDPRTAVADVCGERCGSEGIPHINDLTAHFGGVLLRRHNGIV